MFQIKQCVEKYKHSGGSSLLNHVRYGKTVPVLNYASCHKGMCGEAELWLRTFLTFDGSWSDRAASHSRPFTPGDIGPHIH
jgi:hypothetical protein